MQRGKEKSPARNVLDPKKPGRSLDQFKLISSLGDGAYSKVYKV